MAPVSYTHLDVYKRQVLGILRDGDNAAAVRLHSVGLDLETSRQRVIAVSYTHLDVYKRQSEYCPVRNRGGRVSGRSAA